MFAAGFLNDWPLRLGRQQPANRDASDPKETPNAVSSDEDSASKPIEQPKREVETGERVVVGVNKYRLKPEEVPYTVPVYRYEPTCADRQIERAKKLREERDNVKVTQALKELEEACQSGQNVFPYYMKAFRAYATLQEVCDVGRGVYGLNPYTTIRV